MSHISDPDTDEQVLFLKRTAEDDDLTDECAGPRIPHSTAATSIVPIRQQRRFSKARTKMRMSVGLRWYNAKRLYKRVYEATIVLVAELEDVFARIIFRRGVARLSQDERIAFEKYKSIASVACMAGLLALFFIGVELYNYALL